MADLDDDSFQEVIVATEKGSIYSFHVTGRNFTKRTIVEGLTENSGEEIVFASIEALDIDADGDTDIIASSFSELYLIENNGFQNFRPKVVANQDDDGFVGGAGVAAYDLNGDGRTDILAAAKSAGEVFWLESFLMPSFSPTPAPTHSPSPIPTPVPTSIPIPTPTGLPTPPPTPTMSCRVSRTARHPRKSHRRDRITMSIRVLST